MSSAWFERGADTRQVAVIRASAYGGCVRALSAELQGFTPLPFEDFVEDAMGEGNLHEPDILRRLGDEHGWYALSVPKSVELVRANGYDADDVEYPVGSGQRQMRVYLEPLPGLVKSGGHTDGVARNVSGEHRLIEAKALGQNRADIYRKKGGLKAFPNYLWQISIYMHATGLPCVVIVKNRNTGKLFEPEFFDDPPFSLNEIRAKGAVVLAGAAGKLPPCSQTPEWICPFRYLHEGKADEGTGAADDYAEADAEFDRICETWKMIGGIEKAAKSAREELKKELVSRNKMKSDAFRLVVQRRSRKNYDTDAMKDASCEACGHKNPIDVDAFKHETKFPVPMVYRAKTEKE